nr:immunoglobulin light chain junction region [Macaca mulatta]MPN85194.1 immunoglobulin light chain junction region [Macaca mulatta]MPN85197.1 immunoglobulin light chain junction region [Macaca mulatta]MPN85201.1 immunoglobulin light chain junction region [Macaca mulatta]MPN85208.1 immunoglobulin light chain junction region [Macaca mulatta]
CLLYFNGGARVF